MRTIPFHRSHVAELDLGAEERRQYAQLGPAMFDALDEWDGPAWSLVAETDRIVGCFGMLLTCGEGVLWAALSDQARANRFGLHRAARRCLACVEGLIPAGRVLTAVRRGHDPGRRWVRHLGFSRAGDLQVGNERYERYVKWVHPQQLSSVP